MLDVDYVNGDGDFGTHHERKCARFPNKKEVHKL